MSLAFYDERLRAIYKVLEQKDAVVADALYQLDLAIQSGDASRTARMASLARDAILREKGSLDATLEVLDQYQHHFERVAKRHHERSKGGEVLIRVNEKMLRYTGPYVGSTRRVSVIGRDPRTGGYEVSYKGGEPFFVWPEDVVG